MQNVLIVGEDAFECVKNENYKEGDVFVIRYEEPRGGRE